MGQDKATLLWRGRPLWAWQLDTLRELNPARILLSARSEPSWLPSDVEVVLDESPSRGPLSGLIAGFARSETDHLLALAVDLPFMTASHLRFLAEGIGAGKGIVPVVEDRFQPLVAIYPKEIHMAGYSSDVSLQPLLRRLIEQDKMKPIRISADNVQLYFNMNTRADFVTLSNRSLVSGRT